MKPIILFILGTRPEAIKLAPLVRELRSRDLLHVLVCATAQHRSMMDDVLRTFQIEPDFDLNVMQASQQLPGLAAALLSSLPHTIRHSAARAVIVQGDTTTAFVGALCAFYEHVPIAHVEAGLRTLNLQAPFPEEANRKLIGCLAHWHFAPTLRAKDNLLKEGVAGDRIFVTGNTGIDALRIATEENPSLPDELQTIEGRMILVTGHRRESFGEGIANLCTALANVARLFPDVTIVYPVHLNPQVAEPVRERLGAEPNVLLCEPVSYPQMVALLTRCDFVITDSGGIQEEAPHLGKPVLVTREVTERAEAVEAGCARVVGLQAEDILAAARQLLSDPGAYSQMARAVNPFGDGHASERIAEELERSLLNL